MPVQNTYNASMDAGYVGMIANTEPNNLISRIVETTAGIGFAVPVIQGTSDEQCDVVSGSTDEVIGITVRDQSTENDKFARYDSALLMRSGVIWVTASGTVDAGDPVWVAVSGGAFSNADAGADGSLQLPGCRWETSATNGKLARIRVNLDVPAVAGAS